MATPVDYARVDLGAAHNGRVEWRNIFEKADGSRYIVDKGRHVLVIRFLPTSENGIHYVMKESR